MVTSRAIGAHPRSRCVGGELTRPAVGVDIAFSAQEAAVWTSISGEKYSQPEPL